MDVQTERISVYKLFAKVWSAYCKTLVKEVLHNEKTIVCPILGIFSPMKNLTSFDEVSSDQNKSLCYMPSQLLATNQVFSYKAQPPINLEYTSLDVLKSMSIFKSKALERIPFHKMAKATETIEQTIVYVLKQIVMAVEHTMETGYTTKLNLRVGQLRFSNDGKF